MATFRTNHSGKRGRGSGPGIFRSILLVFVALGILIVLWMLVEKDFFNTIDQNDSESSYEIPADSGDPGTRFFLPKGGNGEIIHHDYYSLSYLEKYEIPEWTAYELKLENLVKTNVPRTDWFEEDPRIKSGSAHYEDYLGSGYTRGHLVPAADMDFSEEAMEQSFYLSNITPQKKAFNVGIWNELEQQVRDWAYKNSRLYVVSGPVLNKNSYKYIGRKNKVAVPEEYFKVLLDADDPQIKAIGFIIPNKISTRPLKEYMKTVDEVEQVTGLDFFHELISESLQSEIESTYDPDNWPVSDKRFQIRLEHWNKQ